MKNIAATSVGEIVARNFSAARVLTAYGIDFCCGGGVTLEDACRQHQVPLDAIVTELNEAVSLPDDRDYASLSVSELIQVIVDEHHAYVRSTIPALKNYLEKLSNVHGRRHPELHQIKQLFVEVATALAIHLEKEELVLFPYIQAMVEAQVQGYPLARPHFDDISHPIRVLEEEHDTEGERFRKIAGLSNHYTVPVDGCPTYRVAYALLQEFENDLHKHIHLENNLLFPRAQALFATFPFAQ